jgi:DNA-binding IclR family transcriptional regulator
MMTATASAEPRSLLGRAFQVLDVCASAEADLSLSELTRASGLPKSSAHRIVAQLVALGGLERRGDRFHLGQHMFVLGSRTPHVRRLRERVLPFLEEVYERTHEIVHLGLLDGLDVLYVDKLSGRRREPANVSTHVGGRMPLATTALGKAILAAGSDDLLRDVIVNGWRSTMPGAAVSADQLCREVEIARRRGVAFEREQSHPGVSCVAAAVNVNDRWPAIAISVTAPTERFQPEAFAHATLLCARGISRSMEEPW